MTIKNPTKTHEFQAAIACDYADRGLFDEASDWYQEASVSALHVKDYRAAKTMNKLGVECIHRTTG